MISRVQLPGFFHPKVKMSEAIEVTITLKDSEKTLRSKSLVYNEFTMSSQDPEIARLIHEALKSFTGEPTDVQVSTRMTL